jgi:hypothetical protein
MASSSDDDEEWSGDEAGLFGNGQMTIESDEDSYDSEGESDNDTGAKTVLEEHDSILFEDGEVLGWKEKGLKAKGEPLEVFLEAVGLKYFIDTFLEANIFSVSALESLGKESSEQLLRSIGATDGDIHKIMTVLFSAGSLGDTKQSLLAISETLHEEDEEDSEGDGQGGDAFDMPEKECLEWLKAMAPSEMNLDFETIEKSYVTGKDLVYALESTREMIDVFGLKTCEQRLKFEKFIRREIVNKNTSRMPEGSNGRIYSKLFMDQVSTLYDVHMGVENMAPMLYSIVRFLKVKSLLEVGAGYTSIFLLQALADNAKEAMNYHALSQRNKCTVEGQPWCVQSVLNKYMDVEGGKGVLHCVDHMGHAHTTANRVKEMSNSLGLGDHLILHDVDFWEFNLPEDNSLDFIWLDFAASNKLMKVFEKWWGRLEDGGFVLVHSTVTNRLTREWLEEMRSMGNEGPFQFDQISFLEPLKMFQNSFSMFQKRSTSYKEPILTKYP